MVRRRRGHEGRFLFTWRERNGPRVEPPRHKGFGHAVIERLVPRALNGRAQPSYEPEGFSWTIDIPASHIRPLGRRAERSESLGRLTAGPFPRLRERTRTASVGQPRDNGNRG